MIPSADAPFFECRDLCVSYDGAQVLHGVNLRIRRGDMVGIIGPNGSGKSTLLKALSGVLPPQSGGVDLMGHSLMRTPVRERARQIGVVHQHSSVAFDFSVRDMVSMGRHSHLGLIQSLRLEDHEIIDRALAQTDCAHLSRRPVTELSGGEFQRVVIARALAQDPQSLLLDEPANHLDLNHQLDIGRLLVTLNRDRNVTVVWVSHDVNLASEFCRRIVLLADGRVMADGRPEEVITEDALAELYGVPIPVVRNPLTGRPQVVLAAEGSHAR